ncbi:aspartyl-phosphate phosphatase Spo0E family protein, partial [Clostridium luticellarii]
SKDIVCMEKLLEKLLEKLRDKLNKMLESDKYTTDEILEISQQLDKLIVSYYKSHKESDYKQN